MWGFIQSQSSKLKRIYMYTYTVINENNKPVAGLFTWTALNQKDKLKVLRNLPEMLKELLPEKDSNQIGNYGRYKHLDVNTLYMCK